MPRLGFAGLGWIGGQRMRVLADYGGAAIVALCDPDARRIEALADACGGHTPVVCDGFERLLEQELDGVVIATPNALHEPQCAAALERGIAVFSQKPLATSAPSTERLIDLARRRNVPLGVDFSYRFLAGVPELKARIAAGLLGTVYAAELWFHNAYGPDAAWYYDIDSAGGGCLLDLGGHLLDLCHWLLGTGEPHEVRGRCLRAGVVLPRPVAELEDFVTADIAYVDGLHVQLSCSWRAPIGCGAAIGCRIFGTSGGASIRNVAGSFYDFEVAVSHGTDNEILGCPPDEWPGRALLDWNDRVRARAGCPASLEHLATTAATIDRIYGR